MKNRIYYVVEKELDDIDGIGTTNGLKNICAYEVKDNYLEEIFYLRGQLNESDSEELIIEFIDEYVKEYNTNNIDFVEL